ncbi:glycosyl transferase family 2 [Kordia periserrulae]|uniref:Glycosyl transferase family 2 n=1 Tax=Kordia periserrulae TaxID=701523 RepID=A0A2T6BYM1_9FLAO|nr:glycosyltransferase family 2 protein [Kordia periserrulae]PTX61181.1 glycosyl transferase family 2 [Kordia periserrulae]
MLLSVCIITKNEASNIQSCLESVKEVASEIIILDAFSTDDTVAIAQNYTNHIYQDVWNNDFSLARNFTISKASGEWILIIDADERFVYNQQFLSNLQTTNVKAFSIIRKEIYRQHHDLKRVQYPVNIIRLFKRTTNARFHYPIHERLDDFFEREHIPVFIQQDCYLDHFISAEISFVNYKQQKYLTQINAYLEAHPNNEWLRYQQIKTLKYFKNTTETFKSIASFQPTNKKIVVATNLILSQLFHESGNTEKAIETLKSIPNYKSYTITNMLLGDFYFSLKKYRAALKFYHKLKTSIKASDFENAMYIACYCEKADKVYKIASVLYSCKYYFFCILFLNRNKKHLQADSLLLYAFIFMKKNDIKQALAFVRKAREKDTKWKKLKTLETALQ